MLRKTTTYLFIDTSALCCALHLEQALLRSFPFAFPQPCPLKHCAFGSEAELGKAAGQIAKSTWVSPVLIAPSILFLYHFLPLPTDTSAFCLPLLVLLHHLRPVACPDREVCELMPSGVWSDPGYEL